MKYPLFWIEAKNFGSYIKPGRFERANNNAAYKKRLTYTTQLKKYLSNTSLRNKIFSCPRKKEQFFRAFGYKGQFNFTIYPNSWLRDLPLLDIGENTYLGEHILLGTNQVDPDQQYIKVGTIKIGANNIFDQHCMIGLNSMIGNHGRFAIATKIGLGVTICNNVQTGAETTIAHKCHIGKNVIIQDNCFIGQFSKIEAGAIIKEHSNIPSFSKVTADGAVIPRRSKANSS